MNPEDKHFVIAIDGPAGAGKSTVAKIVAKRLNFLYVDTGAMYRALTLKALKQNIDFHNPQALIEMAKDTTIELIQNGDSYRVLLDGQDVSNEIRTEQVSTNSHFVASIHEIRQLLWDIQRSYRKNHDIVMEGRDIGSKVFPDAQLKIYLDASVQERAKRRYLQLKQQGIEEDIEKLQREIEIRDQRDKNREIAPLKKLDDAVVIDTTFMTIEQVVSAIIDLYNTNLPSKL